MEIQDYLKDEMKRLNRMNELLEKKINQSNTTIFGIEEQIIKNTSTMCKIAEVLKL